ncbi:MAG: STAS domain-containing protein [Methanoregulaceae archaeon]|nr:STAS domain-containing protein [Methanoregulaceae archaeon]
MEVRKFNKQSFVLIEVSGRVDTTSAPDLETEINRLIGEGNRRLLLNMSDVAYISSGGLRVLLATAKKLRGDNDRLGLCSPSPEVNKILKLAGFTSIFPIYAHEDDAVAAWK